MRLRFPRAARLTRAGEFRRVREQGRSWPGRYLILGVFAPAGGEAERSRVGFVTSKRVSNAVVRNGVRRRLRDLVRRHRPELRDGFWLVVVARNLAARADLAALEAEWLRLARRASIFKAPAPPARDDDVRPAP